MARVLSAASSQYLSVGSTPVTAATYSIAGWWKPTTHVANQVFFCIGDSGSSAHVSELYYSASENRLYHFTSAAGFSQSYASLTPTDGVWYHVGSVERGTTRDCYANGVIGTTATSTVTPTNLNAIYLGVQQYSGSKAGYTNGALAEFGLWNVELTASEFASLAAGASPLMIRPTALVGYWPLLGRGTDEEDWVGGRTLTNTNSATVGDSPRIILPASYLLTEPAAGGGSATDLTVADATHAHTLDNVVLTSSTALVVQDMAHGHALDAPTLSTGTALAVADLAHAHALENVTLSTTGATSLTVADSLHAHALDAVVLTSQTDLAAADMAHGHALDGVTLTLGGISLVIAEIMHAHALDAVALTLDTYLAVADLLHGHAIDNVLVSIPGGTLDLILKILVNRQELNPATGTFTLYDNDGTTVLYTTSAWADAAGTVPYSGGALRRIDALI